MGAPLTTEEAPKPKWYYNIEFVLVMLFFVAGPFGLPLVFKNPRLSRRTKGVLTFAIIAYTLWLIDLTIRAARTITEGIIPTP